MSQTFECGDTGALVAYLYEECEPGDRVAIARHLEGCRSCASEVDALGWTRGQLGAWTPPAADLGFQIQTSAAPAGLPWWRAPLPAWAQAVAALLIFGAGLSIGMARDSARRDIATPTAASAAPAAVSPVLREDLAELESRMKSEMAQMRTPPAAAVPVQASGSEEIMRQVRTLLDESEERQRRDFTLRSVELARDFEAQRRVDLASVRETVGQLQGVTGAEIRQQREAIAKINDYFIRVSQQGR